MYVAGVPTDSDKQMNALAKWREAESEYAAFAAPFLVEGDDSAPELTKDDLVSMVTLRHAADRWREKYFKRLNK